MADIESASAGLPDGYPNVNDMTRAYYGIILGDKDEEWRRDGGKERYYIFLGSDRIPVYMLINILGEG